MKNYADEMLHAELSPVQQETVRARTRAGWLSRFSENFEMLAVDGVRKPFEQVLGALASTAELRMAESSGADLCSGGKDCIRQCQFGAQFYSSALGKIYIAPARCIGCGVCRTACPTDAIQLLSRQDDPQAAGVWLSWLCCPVQPTGGRPSRLKSLFRSCASELLILGCDP